MKINESLLTPNKFSRPQRPLKKVKGLAVHWVGNPGKSARFNKKYFEMRRNGLLGYGSAHFIIDEKEILQCIPTGEEAYHVGAITYTPFALQKFGTYPNNCTIGIELCHINWKGKFLPETLTKAIWLFAFLSKKFNLNPLEDIVRHYDITKKICPKWFKDHVDDFDKFKINVNKETGVK